MGADRQPRQSSLAIQKGRAIWIEGSSSAYAKQICQRNRLIIGAQGETILFFPALNIEGETTEKGLVVKTGEMRK